MMNIRNLGSKDSLGGKYKDTPFLLYKNSFYKNREAENRPNSENFVRITPVFRPRDL